MARIEGEQHGHAGRVREWLARAVNAPRDPAWTADGVVSDRWAPVSPVTGALDAFRWRVPVEEQGGALLAAKVEALAGLGAALEPALEHAGAVKPAAAFPPIETVEPLERPAAVAAPAETAVATIPSPATEPRPAAAARTSRARARSKDDLRERIRLAAQRAIAASDTPEAAPAARPAIEKPPAPRPAPPKPAAVKRPTPQPVRVRKSGEPKIFVPPRAPDDPGPEATEDSALDIGPLGPSGAKA